MAILIMGKYAISKLSSILYHKATDLSIDSVKFIKKYFSNLFQANLSDYKKIKSKAAIVAWHRALIAALSILWL